MRTAAPKGGGANGDRETTGYSNSTPRAAAAQEIPDLPALRKRLGEARRRLIERIADDWVPDRRFPDSGWMRMLADVEAGIQAVDAVMSEAGS